MFFWPESAAKLSATLRRTESVCCWVFLPISIQCTVIPVVANTFSLKREERMYEIEIMGKTVAKETITGK